MKKKILCVLLIIALSLINVSSIMPVNAASSNYIQYSSVLGTGIPDKQYVDSNSYFYVSSKIPTCTGYTFLYWKTYAGTIYYPGERAYFGNGALILTAIWEADTYLVHYDANGGKYPPDDQTKTHGNSLKLSSDVPQRDGYVFVGWGKTANTTTVSYKPKANYTTNASITLYAIWKKAYTVIYLANGGIDAPNEQTKTHGESLKLSTVKPTRTGYTFIGWSTSPYATTAMYKAGGKYTDNASITLYAVWKKKSSTNISDNKEKTDNQNNNSSNKSQAGKRTSIGKSGINTVNKFVDKTTKATYSITGSGSAVAYTGTTNKNATSVSIPAMVKINGITYKVTSIADKAFANQKNLKSVTIGKNVTSIGNKAFYKCTKLTKITIPSKVKKIGKQAFAGCKNLKKIKIKSSKLTKKNVGSKAFSGINKKAKIKVPKKKLSAYKKVLRLKGIGSKVKVVK